MKVYNITRKLIFKVPLSKNMTFKIGIKVLEKECFDATLNEVHWVWALLVWTPKFKKFEPTTK